MGSFIVIYAVANELLGITCAITYIFYLKNSEFFEEQKIIRWFRKHDKKNKFVTSLYKIDAALEKADKYGVKNIYIESYWTPEKNGLTLNDIDNCTILTYDPLFIRDYKRRKWYKMIESHKCQLEYPDYPFYC